MLIYSGEYEDDMVLIAHEFLIDCLHYFFQFLFKIMLIYSG